MNNRSKSLGTIFAGCLVAAGSSFTPVTGFATIIFQDDFSTFQTGAFPGPDVNWVETENPGRTLVSDFEGHRGLTFSTPIEERTRVERSFTTPAGANEIFFSMSVRFPFSTAGNDGMNTQFVPAVKILGDGGSAGDIRLGLQSWGRIRVFSLHPDTGNPFEFNLDSNRDDGVSVYIGTNRFEEFVDLTLSYNRTSGRTTLSATSDTSNAAFLDYSVEWDALPGMSFDTFRISSATSQAGNRGHSENFSQIGAVAVVIPEPSTYALFGGILAFGVLMLRRFRLR